MRKITFIFVIFLCFALASGCTANKHAVMEATKTDAAEFKSQQPTAAVGQPVKAAGNMRVKITADKVNIYGTHSVKGQTMSQLSKDGIIYVLDEVKEKDGRTWYMVDMSFGVTGWIPGWLCEKTDEAVNMVIKNESGEFLASCPDSALFVELLLMDDYSLDNLLQYFGNDYQVYDKGAYEVFEYKNGVKLEVTKDKKVATVVLGDQSIRVDSIRKKECDIFRQQGNEVVILNEDDLYYNLIIINKETRRVLGAYETGYLYIYDFGIGDFVNDGSQQLYISGDGGDDLILKDIFRVVNDDFIKAYDVNSFDICREGINAYISNNILSLDYYIGGHSSNEKTFIPQRVFYNTGDTKDKNKLLSVDNDWDVVQKNGKWYIDVRYTVNITMLTYYWGPPEGGPEENSIMKNDLARIDVLLDMENGNPVISHVEHRMKYDDARLLGIKPMLEEEGALVGGPALGMSMEGAYQALGGELKNYEYSPLMEVNGVTVSEFCNEVVGIMVQNGKYATVRGLKVGDTAEQVESLYGKPDIGFSGDDSAEYKFCYGMEGALTVDFYRTLTVNYKNGLVSSYSLNQVILD